MLEEPIDIYNYIQSFRDHYLYKICKIKSQEEIQYGVIGIFYNYMDFRGEFRLIDTDTPNFCYQDLGYKDYARSIENVRLKLLCLTPYRNGNLFTTHISPHRIVLINSLEEEKRAALEAEDAVDRFIHKYGTTHDFCEKSRFRKMEFNLSLDKGNKNDELYDGEWKADI